jgi:light-harvesting protein B-800-850 alpha chain
VVSPTVGLPLFLASIAITSLIVHYAILSHTTWFGGIWQGKAKPAATSMVNPAEGKAALAALAPAAAPVVVASASN